jgi:hypothetical protein
MLITVYASSPMNSAGLAPIRPASAPNRNEQGIPTNWTSRIAPMSAFCPMPSSVPYAVAILMMVWIPSL